MPVSLTSSVILPYSLNAVTPNIGTGFDLGVEIHGLVAEDVYKRQAFTTDEFDALYEKHKEMGVVCFENPGMGIYFISDPDGYWIEIVPERG